MEEETVNVQLKETKPYPNIGESFLFLLIILCFSLVAAPILFLKDYIGDGLTLFLIYLINFVPPLVIMYNVKKKAENGLKFNLQLSNWKVIIAAILVNYAIAAGISGPIADFMPKNFMQDYMDIFSMKGFFPFLSIVILAPIIEELIFRGIILDGFLKRYKIVTSLIISSFLFGILHINPVQAIPAFIGGIFLGWVYYQTRSVGMTILLHLSINLEGYIALYFTEDVSGGLNTGFIQSYGGWFWFIVSELICLAIIGIGIGWLIKIFRKRKQLQSL